MNNTIVFQFTQTVFAAKCKDQLILLDTKNDEYIALNTQTTDYLIFILENSFVLDNNTYTLFLSQPNDNINMQQLDSVIKNFIRKMIIESCENSGAKKGFATTLSSIGLQKRDWMPPYRDKKPKIRAGEFIKAFMAVRKAHHTLKTQKLDGIINLLNATASHKKLAFQKANLLDVNRLAYTLDNACLMFPQKTLCLPWATALTCLLLKHGIRCSLVIGVQACPFYAHAWVEVDGEIINDNLELRECLAPILKLSF